MTHRRGLLWGRNSRSSPTSTSTSTTSTILKKPVALHLDASEVHAFLPLASKGQLLPAPAEDIGKEACRNEDCWKKQNQQAENQHRKWHRTPRGREFIRWCTCWPPSKVRISRLSWGCSSWRDVQHLWAENFQLDSAHITVGEVLRAPAQDITHHTDWADGFDPLFEGNQVTGIQSQGFSLRSIWTMAFKCSRTPATGR